MSWRPDRIESQLAGLDSELAALPRMEPSIAAALARWRGDAAAIRFHLRGVGHSPTLVAVLGGTGTGKSTLVNRLLGANLSATSFRRTFTAGPVAIVRWPSNVPSDWLGLEHAVVDALPARGQTDRLLIIPREDELTQHISLIDTPDLDGDQPAHHAHADRAFRWAQAVVFLVTPEKYQMTELLPYYRLAERYRVPSLFVMNKAEQQAVVRDYAAQLRRHVTDGAVQRSVFAIPRDDAAFEPSPDENLRALRRALVTLPPAGDQEQTEGLKNRLSDLLGRLEDQILEPLRQSRREADRLIAALRAMESPEAGIDVNPVTRQLQRRLQQKSILYLMGPGRVLDRIRQVPSLLVRLPRTTWDLVMKGQLRGGVDAEQDLAAQREVPDFRAALIEQFTIVQSRIEDAIRSSTTAQGWLSQDESWSVARIDPATAGAIADEELADLRAWLEQRWNATPRDTAVLQKLLKYLPGGDKLTRWSEAAPYLLTIVVATHHAFFGHIDLMILGGYTLATWLTERLSDEVASRTKQTNRRINERFEKLAHEQIQQAVEWMDNRTAPRRTIDRLTQSVEELL